MANESLAVSMYCRNSNLGFLSSNKDYLTKNKSFVDIFHPFPFYELNTAVGLALTAVITDGRYVMSCRTALDIFLRYQKIMEDPVTLSEIIRALSTLFENGFSAFKRLGYPYYYDDFICAYRYVLTQSYSVPIAIKEEMKRILSLAF